TRAACLSAGPTPGRSSTLFDKYCRFNTSPNMAAARLAVQACGRGVMVAQQRQQVALKDYEREPVPDHLRKSWWQMGLVWLGVGITIAAFLLGGAVGAGLSLTDSFIAVFTGSLVLTVIASLCGVVGARTSLSTAMISRFAFGSKGFYLTAMILALGSYGWFGVQTGLFGDTAAVVMEQVVGRAWPTTLLIIIGGILMTSTAVVGYKGIERL